MSFWSNKNQTQALLVQLPLMFFCLVGSAHGACGVSRTSDTVVAFDVAPRGQIVAEVLLKPARICLHRANTFRVLPLPKIDRIERIGDIRANPKIEFSPSGKFFALSFHAGESEHVLQIYSSATGAQIFEDLHGGFDWVDDLNILMVPQVEFGELPTSGGLKRVDVQTGKRSSLCKKIGFLGTISVRGRKVIAHIMTSSDETEADRSVIALVDIKSCSVVAEYPQEAVWNRD